MVVVMVAGGGGGGGGIVQQLGSLVTQAYSSTTTCFDDPVFGILPSGVGYEHCCAAAGFQARNGPCCADQHQQLRKRTSAPLAVSQSNNETIYNRKRYNIKAKASYI